MFGMIKYQTRYTLGDTLHFVSNIPATNMEKNVCLCN